MRFRPFALFLAWVAAAEVAAAGEVILLVSDPAGAASRVGAPASLKVDLKKLLPAGVAPGRLRLVELTSADQKPEAGSPVQFEAEDGSRGTLRWLVPPGGAGQRRFRFRIAEREAPAQLAVEKVPGGFYDVAEGGRRVLRYNHGTVPVPQGIDPKYARGDYISPLYGLEGELLTGDYAADHPHHRGVSWSWPVTRWNAEVRDIWAVVGVWARPVAVRRVEAGPVMALLEAESVWKWGDQRPIVREVVVIRAFRRGPAERFVDIEVRLTGLEDGVAIGGRPHAGYGGFGLRGAAAKDRKITPYTDPAGTSSRRSWLDYSGTFAGAKGPSGVAIFEHPENPQYPSALHQYPECNYVMPAFPGEREVPLVKGETLVLEHRLWIHSGAAEEKTLGDVWTVYAKPPEAAIRANGDSR